MDTDTNINRLLSREDFDFETIARAAAHFGLHARSVVRLDGYEDASFMLETEDGDKAVLKLTANPKAKALIEAETALLHHLARAAPDLPVPRIRRSASGLPHAPFGPDEKNVMVRVHSFLPGRPFMLFRPRSAELRGNLGEKLGRLDDALTGFDHPGYRRSHEWDVVNALRLREFVTAVPDSGVRTATETILDRFASEVAPRLDQFRRSIVHADANDHNVLVSTTESGQPYVSGIVDFGDAVRTITAAEVAIACTYAMLGEADPLAAAADVVSGYHRTFPLQPAEMELLYPLIQARLAMSAVHSARWRAEHGESVYHTVSEPQVWDLLRLIEDINPDFAHHVFRSACGLSASPKGTRVLEHLSRSKDDIGPLFPSPLRQDSAVVFDLSVSSAEAAGPYDGLDADAWSRTLFDRIAAAGAHIGIGRYDEPRVCYSAAQFSTVSGEQRTIHLGMDLFAPPGTPVLAPIDGIVHSFRDNDLRLDYGPTVILEHHFESEGTSFFALYGHLSRESLAGLRRGVRIERGGEIGRIGASGENGGWSPHVHFQLIMEMYDYAGNFPGVAPPSRRRLWTSLCPDPNQILQISGSCFPAPRMTAAEIRATRSRHLTPNLSLSYREPLHVVRGFAQHLYDDHGRAYLDCVNNVAHVGHCHPRVVAAAARQMSVLNTNTRYLHENIVRFAERLSETLPDPLCVCFFVNSGSEANDLALRLARAHTGRHDVVVLGSAYHGHLTSLIEISPYKAEGRGGSGLPAFVHRIHAPDTFRGPYRTESNAPSGYAGEIEDVLSGLIAAGKGPAAFVAESALSCAGQIMLPRGYLSKVYTRVRSAGGVCIADEVQVGFGRIGSHFWAFESQDVVPDIVTMGKPIGNGHPLGAVVTTPAIAASFDGGMEYFNTFGGNPVSCAVGLAVLDVIEDEGLQPHALAVGSRLISALRGLTDRHPVIGDVRGAGLFVGIELVRGGTLIPAAAEADYVVNRMKEHGILLSTDGPDRNVIKFKPPMVFSESDADRLVSTLDTVLAEDYLNDAITRSRERKL